MPQAQACLLLVDSAWSPIHSAAQITHYELGSLKASKLECQVGLTAVHCETKVMHWDWAPAGLEATGSHVRRPPRPS